VANLRFVICVRNPIEVANSLAKRNGIAIEHGFYLWNRYMRDAIRDTAGCPRIFAFYDDFFRDSTNQVRRLATFCGLKSTENTTTFQEVVLTDRRHYENAGADLYESSAADTECKLLYLFLSEIVRGRSAEEIIDPSADSVLSEFLRVTEALRRQSRVAQLEENLTAVNAQLARAQSELADASRALTLHQEQYAILEHRAADLQRFADAVRRTWVYRLYRRCVNPLASVFHKTVTSKHRASCE
jgi:hypothetical protein